MTEESLHITAVETENIMRLKAAQLVPGPDDSLVIIGGDNEQGKTSFIISIMMGLLGQTASPDEPIRKGAKKGTVKISLGNGKEVKLRIERTFTAKTHRLVLKSADGEVLPSPQTILDGLVNTLMFDPLAFTRMKPAQQLETVKQISGLDFGDLDKKREAFYEERLRVGRDGKALKAKVESMPYHKEAPAEAIVVTEKLAELGEVDKHNGKLEAADKELESLREEYLKLENLVKESQKSMDRLKVEGAALAEARKAMGEPKDRAELMSQIDSASHINKLVAENADRAVKGQELGALEACYNTLTAAIEDCDDSKQKIVEGATFPIPEMTIHDGTVYYGEAPFDQASSAQQLRASVAMGAALNPKLKVAFIKDGSLLDDRSLRLLGEYAREHDVQVWVERVSKGKEVSVIIEDGEILGAEAPVKEKKSRGRGKATAAQDLTPMQATAEANVASAPSATSPMPQEAPITPAPRQEGLKIGRSQKAGATPAVRGDEGTWPKKDAPWPKHPAAADALPANSGLDMPPPPSADPFGGNAPGAPDPFGTEPPADMPTPPIEDAPSGPLPDDDTPSGPAAPF